MSQAEENLGLSEEDLVDIDKEVIEHAVWFTAEETLDHDDDDSDEENSTSEDPSHKEAEPTKNEELTTQYYYADLIEEEEQSLHLILKAHFLEDAHKAIGTSEKEEFIDIAEEYQAYFDDDVPPEDIDMLELIEAHYLLDDFLEEADIYDDNPVYFLKKTTDYPLPPDILEKAQNMSDEEVIYLLSKFCIYDEEEEEAVLRDPETIKSKEIMSVIQKLAALEQID